jgi:CheY-like chemotaxis protein
MAQRSGLWRLPAASPLLLKLSFVTQSSQIGPKPRSKRPTILVVDDDIDQATIRKAEFSSFATVLARTPDDVDRADLQKADLVLLDVLLEQWIPQSSAVAEQPRNGIALAAVLRSHFLPETPIAFALHSGQLDGLSGGMRPTQNLHAIARLNNVEWVFSKNNELNARPLATQVASLVKALRVLPVSWPTKAPARMQTQVESLLSLPDTGWATRAWKQVEGCDPPIRSLAPPTYSVTLVRWLLTRILPFPTFLWDHRFVAARLRVTPASLLEALRGNSAFAKALGRLRYRGILSDFFGDRWWSAGLESWLWEQTGQRAFDGDALKKLAKRMSRKLKPVGLTEPVVAFDEELVPFDELKELAECVELQPDDWPSYATRPWAPKNLISTHSELEAIVDPDSVA